MLSPYSTDDYSINNNPKIVINNKIIKVNLNSIKYNIKIIINKSIIIIIL